MRLPAILTVARHDLLDLRRQPRVWLGLLIIPFVTVSFLLLLPGVLAQRETATQQRAVHRVAIEGTGDDVAALAEALPPAGFRLVSVTDARAAVLHGDADLGLHATGAIEPALAAEDGQVQGELLVLGGSNRSRAALGAVVGALGAHGLELTDARLRARGLAPATVRPLVVEEVDLSRTGRGRRLNLASLLPLLVLLPLASTVGVAAQRISGAKDQRVFEPLLVLPFTRREILLGKGASSCVIGAVTLGAVGLPLLAGRFVPLGTGGRTVDLPLHDVGLVLLVAVALLLLLVSLGIAVGAASRTSAELGSVLQMVTLPIFLLGSFLQFRSGIPSTPSLLALPFFGLLLCVRDVAIGALTAAHAAVAVGAGLGWGTAFVVIAARFLDSERSVLRTTT